MKDDLSKIIEKEEFCFICGKGDLPHPQCEPTEEELKEQTANEIEMLREFSLSGRYGPSGLSSELGYEEALEVFSSFFKDKIMFSEDEVIESADWWYFPQTWIGCVGYIIDKRTRKIFCLGSGLLGGYFGTKYRSHWAGIKAYQDGKVESVSS